MRSDLKDTFEHLTAARGFTKEAGFHVRDFKEGFVALEVAPKEELVQFMGYVHAGVVTGLADHAAGACYASVLPEGKACLTIELKINFMKPAQGDMLVAEATALSRGASIGVVRSDVWAETGGNREMVATALVTLKSITL
ncbi:PaaI family thioesterase [Marinicaulis aureus]|uniref:Medium/long-chain acyl-CoA thioesterase YigI n=1 Tax=Hyphococcus aureus TaxID=2666033 RepID=A0ABW1KZE7_9PROT